MKARWWVSSVKVWAGMVTEAYQPASAVTPVTRRLFCSLMNSSLHPIKKRYSYFYLIY